eukprot:GILK01006691.1.p1 GENE.GILK01006691.1~~GILK01006691.1.p1  ORF type:complete len:348 (-),score=85.10 GILK01006691.1:157-1200(-)
MTSAVEPVLRINTPGFSLREPDYPVPSFDRVTRLCITAIDRSAGHYGEKIAARLLWTVCHDIMAEIEALKGADEANREELDYMRRITREWNELQTDLENDDDIYNTNRARPLSPLEMQNKINEQQKIISTLKKQLGAIKRTSDSVVDKIETDFDLIRDKSRERHHQEIQAIRETAEQQLKDAEQNFKEQLDAIRNGYEDMVKRIYESKDQENAILKADLEQQMKALMDQSKRREQEWENRWKELQHEHNKELNRLQADSKNRLDSMQSGYEKQLHEMAEIQTAYRQAWINEYKAFEKYYCPSCVSLTREFLDLQDAARLRHLYKETYKNGLQTVGGSCHSGHGQWRV